MTTETEPILRADEQSDLAETWKNHIPTLYQNGEETELSRHERQIKRRCAEELEATFKMVAPAVADDLNDLLTAAKNSTRSDRRKHEYARTAQRLNAALAIRVLDMS